MDTLKNAVIKTMMGYAKKGANSQSYLTYNDDQTLLTVVTMVQDKHDSFLSLLVRIVADTVIIECDQNDKPLVDALIQAGIPREKIILAFAGEAVPETIM